MKDKLKTITNLTNEWYQLISRDHHKDRDCHFYINTVWSYSVATIPPNDKTNFFGRSWETA